VGIIWTENEETKTLLAFSYDEGESNKKEIRTRKNEKIETLLCSAADTSRHRQDWKDAHCMTDIGQCWIMTQLYRTRVD